MDSEEIVRMMSHSHSMELTCAEAAGAMAAILARVHTLLTEDDFTFLVILGGVLFREGLKEYESSKEANDIIQLARHMRN